MTTILVWLLVASNNVPPIYFPTQQDCQRVADAVNSSYGRKCVQAAVIVPGK